MLRGSGLWVVGLPMVLACVNWVWGSTPGPMAAAQRKPALAFDQYLVDLEKVPPSEEVLGRFAFTNVGDQPVTIDELVPSCGCLRPQLLRKVYAPGEAGTLPLKVQTANEPTGRREYSVTIKYRDPEPQQAHITFRVTLPEDQVFVRPRALIFYVSAQNERATLQELVITDRRAQPLEIERIACANSSVEIGATWERETDEHGHRRFRIPVKVLPHPVNPRQQSVVTVYTRDPAYREIKVPLWVEVLKDNNPISFDVKPTFKR